MQLCFEGALIQRRSCAPIDQLDRALSSGAYGRWFESSLAYYATSPSRLQNLSKCQDFGMRSLWSAAVHSQMLIAIES